MGIKHITFFCFDAMVNGDIRETKGEVVSTGQYPLYGHLQIKKEAMECVDNCETLTIQWVIP
jgi:hypothetical protein